MPGQATSNQQAPIIPLRNFFRNPDRTGYKISPDGQFVSFLSPYERRLNIHVIERAKLGDPASARRVTSETSRDIAGYWWKNNERLVYLKDFSGDENFHLFAVKRDGTEARDLTPFENVRVMVVDELLDFPHEMLIAMNQRVPEVFDVYRINVETGEMSLTAENPGNITHWKTDHAGKIRMAISADGVNATIFSREKESDPLVPISTTSFKEQLDPLTFSFDNQYVFASSNVGRDKMAIVKMDPRTAQELEVLFEHPEVDIEWLAWSEKRKVLTTISYLTWKQERFFLDKETERIYQDLGRRLPGYEIGIADQTKDELTFVVRTHSDRSLGAYYLYDVPTGELINLAEVSPWLEESMLAPMEPISYCSRDGLTIHGYLTMPVGVEHKNLPVVVNPHGGPWVRDRWGYNPEVQFLANRGYAVLQVNYRGSTGYGRKFWEAAFKEWGGKMQDDLTDGAQWLIEQGIADPKRVGIYGGSYGGYAALAGVAFTPDVYACGIDYVGVSNLFTFMGTIPPYWKPFLETMYEMVGHPERDSELLRAASPVFHADQIKAPLLVIQGAKDPRVNINESNQIVEALRSHGIDVPYIVKENEGHGFRNEENRFEVYEAMEKFLAKYLGGRLEDQK